MQSLHNCVSSTSVVETLLLSIKNGNTKATLLGTNLAPLLPLIQRVLFPPETSLSVSRTIRPAIHTVFAVRHFINYMRLAALSPKRRGF